MKDPDELIAGEIEYGKLIGMPSDELDRINRQPWVKTENVSEVRAYLIKANISKKYLDQFDAHIMGLVKNKNSSAWKDSMAEMFKDLNLPVEVGEKLKKIGPDTLPDDHAIRKKLLLDVGIDPEEVNKLHPFLDWLEDLHF